jgi:hypothetical protein
MYIGLGIVLLVAGLVLAMDVVQVDHNFIKDKALGAILIVGGVLASVFSLVLAGQRRRTAVVHDHDHDLPVS